MDKIVKEAIGKNIQFDRYMEFVIKIKNIRKRLLIQLN